jgi:hypothetical protein
MILNFGMAPSSGPVTNRAIDPKKLTPDNSRTTPKFPGGGKAPYVACCESRAFDGSAMATSY